MNRVDYSFYVDWDAAPDGRVDRSRDARLAGRQARGLMIFVNNTWGKVSPMPASPAFIESVHGKVKMSTRPGEHQGLGLAHYLWASSPLRRYSDLINQRQLIAVLGNDKPPYADNDAELFAAMTDFEATYSQYAEFQDRIEQYWCLRWLLQEKVQETMATVLRDNLVRFERLPMVVRLPDLPPLAPETTVRVAIGRIDLLAATLESRYAGLAG